MVKDNSELVGEGNLVNPLYRLSPLIEPVISWDIGGLKVGCAKPFNRFSRGFIAGRTGDENIIHLVLHRLLHHQLAGLIGIVMTAVGRIDVITDIAGVVQFVIMSDSQIAVADPGSAVMKIDSVIKSKDILIEGIRSFFSLFYKIDRFTRKNGIPAAEKK